MYGYSLKSQSVLAKIQSEAGILDVTTVARDEEDSLPWERQTEISKDYPVILDALPKQLEIVKANLLYVLIAKLPAKLINRVRKLAAFQNPEFYRAQAMRLSTFGKPRVIHCAEVFSDYVGLPRGCEEELLRLFSHYEVQVDLLDKREMGNEIQVSFLGELSSDQQAAVNTLLKYDIGVLSARTGFGKTVVAAKMIAERKTNTLILVHRQQLLDQWQKRLMSFLNLDKKQLGIVKNGKFKLTAHIDIAMLQRNQMILEEVIKSYQSDRHSLLLTNRTKQLDWFEEKLNDVGINDVYVLKGGMNKKAKAAIMQAICLWFAMPSIHGQSVNFLATASHKTLHLFDGASATYPNVQLESDLIQIIPVYFIGQQYKLMA